MRQSRLTIDLDVITHNFNALSAAAHPATLLPVVKANAYGAGAIIIAKHLIDIGAQGLMVAFLHEATALIEAGITAPILVQHVSLEQVPGAVNAGVDVTVWSAALINALNDQARKSNRTVNVHLMLDTGMHREGALWDNALVLASAIHNARHLVFAGLMSHLAVADEPTNATTATQQAIDEYEAFLTALTTAGIEWPPVRHIANSDAIGRHHAPSQTRVRTGIALYGYSCEESQRTLGLQHALRFTTRILETRLLPSGARVGYGHTVTTNKETLVALLPVGYADGYSRALSNHGTITVYGVNCPILGRVSMDILTIDISDVAQTVRVGDEAVLFGASADEPCLMMLAAKANTIPYEILTNVSQRVERRYLQTVGVNNTSESP